jgi:hypothetical protein
MKLRIALFVVMTLTPVLLLVGCGSDSTTVGQPDTTPPLAPVILGVRGASSSVGVWWIGGNEPDLAGYNVYVRDGGVIRRVNPEVVTSTKYNHAVGHGGSVYVYVTSVDYTGNESGPSENHWVKLSIEDQTGTNHGKVVEEHGF